MARATAKMPRHLAKWSAGHCKKLKFLMITPRLNLTLDYGCYLTSLVFQKSVSWMAGGGCVSTAGCNHFVIWRKKFLQRGDLR